MNLDSVTCLDIGTGTGILLLVAAHLGIKHLVGIDIEEYAAKQARINCDNNHVVADIICGNLDTDFKGTDSIDFSEFNSRSFKNFIATNW